MAIRKKTTSTASVKSAIEQAADIINEEMTKALAYLGEECVKRIRENPNNWTDQTGNLRSSIGYAVCNYGRTLIKSQFESVKGKTGIGNEGSAIGDQYVEQLAQKYSDVYTLVVVAGMSYAEHLEEKGHDVLSGTEVWAKTRIDSVIRTYSRNAEKRIKSLVKSI